MLANGQSQSTSGTNFYAGGEAALKLLIQQLLGGGTEEQRAEQIRRLEEVQSVRGQREGYSKEAAFADAKGAQNQQSRLAMEKLIPSIMAAAQGAGTSQGSMRALLTQDAANKAAESAAALGLKASVDYGNISGGMNQVLEALTRQGNPITDALLKALEISKGSNENKISGGSYSSSGQSAYGNIGYGGTMAPIKWGDDLLDGTFVATNNQPSGMSGIWGTDSTYGTLGDPTTAGLTDPNAGPINTNNWNSFTF